MPDLSGQYEHDIVVWSGRQAELLRRLAAGERVNEHVDWDNVVEEIESVGRNEWHAVQSLLVRAMKQLLKLHGWPDGPAEHWRHETRVFLGDARRAWAPSMQRLIDPAEIFDDARNVVGRMSIDGRGPKPLPPTCPYTLADLIVPRPGVPDIDALLAKLSA